MAKCKFYKEIQYYSDDNGSSWYPTGLSRKGELIESGSTDCNEPTPIDGKYLFTYSDSLTRTGACDASSAITSADTRSNMYPYTAMTKAQIGDCVTEIAGGYSIFDDGAFNGCTSLQEVEFGSNVTNIGGFAFYSCYSLTSVTMPNSVTYIGSAAFLGCGSLQSITCLATTPPTLGEGDTHFSGTNNCPIYVPSGSVSAYQSAWSIYASRIQAIPNS